MLYNEKMGDLFTVSEDYVLVHCIAKDFLMGAGIAVQFVKRHPELRDTLEKLQRTDSISIGDAVYYNSPRSHHVINLITKEKSVHKPTRLNFNRSIDSLRELCEQRHIKKLAMPTIGAGIDQLDWDESRDYIQHAFKNTGVEILVVRLPE